MFYVRLEVLRRHLGIEYEYAQEEGAETRASARQEELTREAVAVLPPDLRRELADAVENGDIVRFRETIEPVEPQHPELARLLLAALDRYDYEVLLDVLPPEAEEEAGPGEANGRE